MEDVKTQAQIYVAEGKHTDWNNSLIKNIDAVLNEIKSYTLDQFINGYGEAGVPTHYYQIISQVHDNPLAKDVCSSIRALRENYYIMQPKERGKGLG